MNRLRVDKRSMFRRPRAELDRLDLLTAGVLTAGVLTAGVLTAGPPQNQFSVRLADA
jgi:hypothetical protein